MCRTRSAFLCHHFSLQRSLTGLITDHTLFLRTEHTLHRDNVYVSGDALSL